MSRSEDFGVIFLRELGLDPDAYVQADEISAAAGNKAPHMTTLEVWCAGYAGAMNSKISGETSDGYHTFNELYDHRCLLWINLILSKMPGPHYWVKDHFPDWDMLMMQTGFGQISYHVPMKFRELYERKLPALSLGSHHWDGHTSKDVIERLKKIAKDSR